MKLSEIVAFIEDPSQFQFTVRGESVKYLDESGSISDCSRFFVAGREFGAQYLIHVESYCRDGFSDAWSTFIDQLPVIDDGDLLEALRPEDGDGESFESCECRE